jgi:hypothetical protein
MLAGNIPGKTQTMPVAIFFAADGGDMPRALASVVLIVILSLATIAGLDYWTPRARLPRQQNTAPATASNPLAGETAITTYRSGTEGSNSNGASLETEFRKSFPGFKLSITGG